MGWGCEGERAEALGLVFTLVTGWRASWGWGARNSRITAEGQGKGAGQPQALETAPPRQGGMG